LRAEIAHEPGFAYFLHNLVDNPKLCPWALTVLGAIDEFPAELVRNLTEMGFFVSLLEFVREDDRESNRIGYLDVITKAGTAVVNRDVLAGCKQIKQYIIQGDGAFVQACEAAAVLGGRRSAHNCSDSSGSLKSSRN
jgi:hypothetical protein